MIALMRCLTYASVCLLGLTRCVTSDYPDYWPAPARVSATNCPALTGSYANIGDAGDASTVTLAQLFFPIGLNEPLMKNYELMAVSHLTFEYQANGDLFIKAWVGDEFYRESQLTLAQLPCREGRLVYQDASLDLGGLPPFVPVIMRSSIDRLLSLATDGSLLMENHELSAGAVLIIPVGIKAQYWYRFPPATSAANDRINGQSSPRGVRSLSVPASRLAPPPNAIPWSGYREATTCLEQAARTNEAPDPQQLALLDDHSTQSFVIQNGPNGELFPTGTVVGNNWLPSTHELRIEKLHWQAPSVADNYILCLLDKGYSWDVGAEAHAD